MPFLITADLDPAQLEVTAEKALADALTGRGLTSRHNGSRGQHAPGGKPDVELFNRDFHLNVEVTKLMHSRQANNEATPVVAHLETTIANNPEKVCIAVFVAPATSPRSASLFQTHNRVHSGASGGEIVSLNFNAFNLLVEWLKDAGSSCSVKRLVELLRSFADCPDDESVLLKLNDSALKKPSITNEVIRIRQERLAAKYARLDSIFRAIHKDLRSVVGLAPPEAFYELSKLVFLKMYEEQRVLEDEAKGGSTENRFTTKFIREARARRGPEEAATHPIRKLFDGVKAQHTSDGLFEVHETLDIQPGIDEGNYIDEIVAKVEEFSFIDPDAPTADVKGLIYEQFLGLSLKNTDLGQYFTPEAVVAFMTQLARLRVDDRVLDPACGTGRFLVHAMDSMLGIAETAAQRRKIQKKQLVGNELSPQVSKIAKMNMFVHGDGKTNVSHRDSLTYSPKRSEKPTVILTNPPLGDVNFAKLVGSYDDAPEWYDSLEVIRKDERQLRRGGVKRSVSLSQLKGGALFLNKFAHWLEVGGRVLTIIDDAILNTDEYEPTRVLLRKYFNVVAVISLTADAFKFGSKTSTKTSILVLERKAEGTVQSAPTFFAHASAVGVDTKGRPCPNDLMDPLRPMDILRAFERFEEAKARAVRSGNFQRAKFRFPPRALPDLPASADSDFSFFARFLGDPGERLEYKWHDPTYIKVARTVRGRSTLGAISEQEHVNYGVTATGLPEGDIRFINIENLGMDGRVHTEGIRYLEGAASDFPTKAQVQAQDLLISRSRIPGIAAVATNDVTDCLYGSYIIRFRLSESGRRRFLPEYVALCINSVVGQAQVYRLKSGSNGYNINSSQLAAIKIPELPIEDQGDLVQEHANRLLLLGELGSLVRSIQLDGDWDFVATAIGASVDSASPDALASAVKKFRKDVSGELLDVPEPDGLESLGVARRRLSVRGTFTKGLGSAEPDLGTAE